MRAMRMPRILLAVIARWCVLAAGPVAAIGLPRIRYVFIIVLENKGFDETFGPASPAVYLSQQLAQQGQLLRQYYATGHVSLDNYITLVSGQAPNLQTQSDCQFFNDFIGSPTLNS